MRVLEVVLVSHTKSSAQRVGKDVPRAASLVRSNCESRPPGSVLMKQAPCRGYDDVPHPSLGSERKHDKQMFGASTFFSLHVTIITSGEALTFKCTPLVPFSPLLKVLTAFTNWGPDSAIQHGPRMYKGCKGPC